MFGSMTGFKSAGGLLLAVALLSASGCRKEQAAPPAPPAQAATGDGRSGPAGVPAQQIVTPSGAEMVLIRSGSFTMGEAGGRDDAKPPHRVTVDSFYMDKLEVTQAAFLALMGLNTSKAKGDTKPVEQVSWFHAARYCNARSEKEGLRPCYDIETWACNFTADGYRLPTEAEWEYACRAGTDTVYSFGDNKQKLTAYAWFKKNSSGQPHPVGGRHPNPWGLHDMHGNVLEWCNDFYAPDTYGSDARTNPTGPAEGKQRVLRGGGWRSRARNCTSAHRDKGDPENLDTCLGYPDYGFRCVRRVTDEDVGESGGRARVPLTGGAGNR